MEDDKTYASTIKKCVKVLDNISWLETSGNKVNENKTCDSFQKCNFSQAQSVNEEAKHNLEFRNLLQFLTTEVTVEEYLCRKV